MPIAQSCKPIADPDPGETSRWTRRRWLAAMLLSASPLACTQAPDQVATAPSATPPAPPVPMPFSQAVQTAADSVLSSVQLAPGDTARHAMVIDPLVNGVTGEQSAATQQIQAHVTELVQTRYTAFQLQPFTSATVSKLPLVLIGTFTPTGTAATPVGPKDAYRFCLILADLRTGKVAAKKVVFAQAEGVDAAPSKFFADSPSWAADARIKAYVDTCQKSKVGDPIDPIYLDGIVTAAEVNEAIAAYEAGRYRDALELYRTAAQSKAGDQLRVYNGVYLSTTHLGAREPAERAFGDIVDYGLRSGKLGIKLLFQPGSPAFVSDPRISGSYDMWLRQLAQHSARRNACLGITGNTSASGLPALNDRLSLARAEFVRARLEVDGSIPASHITVSGAGSRNNLIGTGRDDVTDALDRRVDFTVAQSC
jgi:hypothetical protein